MKVKSQLKNLRVAPRKTKLVTDLIRGLDVAEALNQLDVTVKRSMPYVKKLLLSAIANGENNFGLDKDNLYVYDAFVGAGPTLVRWMPKAYGRAGKILKRTSNITIVLEEKIEGKGRKSQEQIEEERRKRLAKSEKVREEQGEDKEEKKKSTVSAKKEDKREGVRGSEKKGWTSKIFRRKSM